MKYGLRKTLVFCLLWFGWNAVAIIPLPYPTEPIEDELQSVEVKDPKSIQLYYELQTEGQRREMELPSFDNQTEALGYKAGETFVIPPELKPRVDFWKKIYSEYSSTQAVLHDMDNPDIVYGVVDISSLLADNSVSYRKKMKAVNKFLKAEKEKISAKLEFLHANQNNPLNIPVEDFALFKKFESLPGRDKFLAASDRVRAQIGQRDRIVQGFLYGGRYFHKMMEIFEKKRVPRELSRLCLVESAFNLGARSKVGASGVWQFMRSTGKKFLHIDRFVDERNDPITATNAAADLLRGNFDALGSWPLAVTAYNHGREGMAKAVRQVGSNDLVQIIKRYKSRTFGFASSNFYTEFLAIIEVERDYRRIFGKLMVDPPLEWEDYPLPSSFKFDTLADMCGVTEHELALLNPALADIVITGKANVPGGFKLKVPLGKAARCKTSTTKKVTSLHQLRMSHSARVAARPKPKASKTKKRVRVARRH